MIYFKMHFNLQRKGFHLRQFTHRQYNKDNNVAVGGFSSFVVSGLVVQTCNPATGGQRYAKVREVKEDQRALKVLIFC